VAEGEEMKANPARVKVTYDDFLLFPDDGKRHELIDGEHYVTPSPNIRHQSILGNLYFLIRTWLEQHPVGRAFMAPWTSSSHNSMSSNPICCSFREIVPRTS
jgi:Uma2 family endonuclease